MFDASCHPHSSLHFTTMIIVPNDSSSNSDTKKGSTDVKVCGPLTPVPSVCLIFWSCFCCPELGMISTIYPLRIFIVRRLHQRYHLYPVLALAVSPRFLTSNLPILPTWAAQMKVSKDRGWLTLPYPSLRFSYLHHLVPEKFEVICFLDRRTERSTQIYFCCRPVIRTKILQNSLIYRQNQVMGALKRDW